MTTNVSLTPELEDFVNAKVRSGDYKSVSEVIREGLRMLKEKERRHESELAVLRQAIQKGIDSGAATPLDIEQLLRQAHQAFESSQQKPGR